MPGRRSEGGGRAREPARSSGARSAESTVERGARGEARAVRYLEERGYRIVERNFRARIGEIDIVARDGDTLVFVEVRTRADAERGTALETVGPKKQRRLARVAELYLARRAPVFAACRFDVVGITAGEITLVRDAFRLG